MNKHEKVIIIETVRYSKDRGTARMHQRQLEREGASM